MPSNRLFFFQQGAYLHVDVGEASLIVHLSGITKLGSDPNNKVQVCSVEEALRIGADAISAHYWSRSRGKLWKKGEASGNIQKIKGILIDCDCDALMFVVEQKGNVCHKGKETCFHSKLKEISSLEEIQLPLCW